MITYIISDWIYLQEIYGKYSITSNICIYNG